MDNSLIQSLIRETALAMQHFQVPGVALGIWHAGDEFTTGLGITNVENALTVTPDTLFQIGSITKTMVGTVAMMLVEQGRLDLDAPVRTYLPELRLQDEDARARVTMRHLLTHRGGWVGDYFRDTGRGDDAVEKIVAQLAELPQLTPLGDMYSYNNAGFYILGLVIQNITGMPFERALKTLVFDPLGMKQAFILPEEVMTYRFVVGHESVGHDSPQVARPWQLARSASAAGGVCCSVRDLLCYARLHLRNGIADDGTRVLSEESARLMRTPQFDADNGRKVGIAFFLQKVGGVTIAQHGGATNGQMATLQIVPDHDFALAILTNSDRGGELYLQLNAWILEHFLNLKEPERPLLEMGAAALQEYVGLYKGALSMGDIELYLQDGLLILQEISKGGFPDQDSPPSPNPPPVRAALDAPDALIALDEPFKNTRGEFIRNRGGAIEWLRISGRLCRRVNK